MAVDEPEVQRLVLRGRTFLWATPFCFALGVACFFGAIDSLGGAAGDRDVLWGVGFALAAPVFVWIAVRTPMGGIRADSKGVKITNVWSRHSIAWTELEDIDYEESGWESSGDKPVEWILLFVRYEGVPVSASFPRGKISYLEDHRLALLRMRDGALGRK